MQDDGCHDIVGAHGDLEPVVAVRKAPFANSSNMSRTGRQAPALYFVRLEVMLLEYLGVEYICIDLHHIL